MGLNAAGCYGFLVRAHIAFSVAGEPAVAGLGCGDEARTAVQARVVADLNRRIDQVDKAVETATARGRTAAAGQRGGVATGGTR
jgi:hypothetical protein